MTERSRRWTIVRSRAEDGMREMGVLFMVFSPLDLAFAGLSRHVGPGLFFFALGSVLFVTAIALEIKGVPRA